MADTHPMKQALGRTLTAAVAVLAAGSTALALAKFEDAARGPLEDIQLLVLNHLEQLSRSQPSLALLEARHRGISGSFRRDLDALREGRQPLIGVWDPALATSFERWRELEHKFENRFHLVGYYVGWRRGPAGAFPTAWLQTIWDAGSVPVLTWEPWVSALDDDAPANGRGSLRDVASGRYDRYIDAFAAETAESGRPLFMRFAHEMNDPYRYPWGPAVGNEPEDFVAAFRHVRGRFVAAHATNVLWVFAPSLAYPGFEKYYPGKDAVDWVATAVLNYGTAARWSRWWSFDEILTPSYDSLVKLGHPIMLAETSSTRLGGRAREWYEQARFSLGKFPAVRALVLFHDANDKTLGSHTVDFGADDDMTRGAVTSLLSAFQNPTSLGSSQAAPPE